MATFASWSSEDVDGFFQKYEDIKTFFAEAEQDIKFNEQKLGEGVSAPAVLQLRYAGFHVLQSLTTDGQESEKHRMQAKDHAERSAHDACEAAIDILLKRIQAFEHDYRLVQIKEVLPAWVDMKVRVQEIDDCLHVTYPRNHVSERPGLRAFRDELLKIERTLNAGRDELNKKMRQEADKRILAVGGFFVAVLGTVIVLMKLYFL